MLAFFSTQGRGASDRLLAELANRLRADGVRMAGAVQVNTERPGQKHCDMELHVLDGTDVLRISQNLGRGARGCRLDPDGLERTVALVEASLSRPVDLMIVNKFGKQELDGRGFRPLIGQALSQDVPVLTSVTGANRAAFLDFSDGLAEELPAELGALLDWCRAATGLPAPAA